MGTKVNDYAIGDANLTSVMDTLDRQRKGYHGVSLTEYDTDNEPEIAAGSLVEVGGALYKFDTNEPIGDAASDDPIDGDLYIRLVPDGDDITADFTNTAPTWDDSKQGWYGTGGEANYRYLNFGMVLDSGDYKEKYCLLCDNNLTSRIYFEATETKVSSESDSTQRTTSSETYVDEANLDLSIIVKENDIIVVRFDGTCVSTELTSPDYAVFCAVIKIVLESGNADIIKNSNEAKIFFVSEQEDYGTTSKPVAPWSCEAIFKATTSGILVFRNQFKREHNTSINAIIEDRVASAFII